MLTRKKNYEIVKTLPNPDALKMLKRFNSISDNGLMRSYIHGFEKTMKEAKENYDEFFYQKILESSSPCSD
jgi:hypothetical protein